MIPTPVIVTFALVLSIIAAAYFLLIVKPETDEQSALRKRLKGASPAMRAALKGGLLREEVPFSAIPLVNALMTRAARIVAPVQRFITRSGLNLTVGTLVLICLCAAAAGYLLAGMFIRLPLASLVFGVLAGFVPVWWVSYKGTQRIRKFEEQFPEAIDQLSRALKAGHAFTTGLSMVAEEMPPPVGTEFRLAYDRQNFGMPLPTALKLLGERVPLLDARFFVTAVLTQREAGGNLSEVLDNLADVIRERFKVKRQVRVITAHARITGWVLAFLPPSLGLALTALAPQHMSLLWTHPTGIKMVIGAIVLQVIGTLVIRKLVDVEY